MVEFGGMKVSEAKRRTTTPSHLSMALKLPLLFEKRQYNQARRIFRRDSVTRACVAAWSSNLRHGITRFRNRLVQVTEFVTCRFYCTTKFENLEVNPDEPEGHVERLGIVDRVIVGDDDPQVVVIRSKAFLSTYLC